MYAPGAGFLLLVAVAVYFALRQSQARARAHLTEFMVSQEISASMYQVDMLPRGVLSNCKHIAFLGKAGG